MNRNSPAYRPVSSGRAPPRRHSDRSWEGARPRLSVGFLLARNFTLTPLSSFLDVLRLAADEGDSSRQVHCRWTVMGLGREPVRSSCGLDTVPWDDLRDVREFDYIVVVGGLLDEGPQLDTTTQAYLREAAARGVTLVGLCTGTFALVEAGLMTGHQCCVSWYHHRDFANRFPDHPFVADQLFLVDRDRITCSGGTAAADLAAYLIDRHVGAAAAQKAMHILLAERMRSPGQAQPQPPSASPVTNERVRKATLLMEQNLSTTLSVGEIAKRVQLSIRQLDRLFHAETGMSPLSYYRQLRLNYVRWMLINTGESITDIALEAGFSDGAHLSRQFRAAFGVPPSALRHQSGAAAASLAER
jgi:transcriptional regulator GlxA family with amidase domain